MKKLGGSEQIFSIMLCRDSPVGWDPVLTNVLNEKTSWVVPVWNFSVYRKQN